MSKLVNFLTAGALIMSTTTATLANDAVATMRAFYEVADARPMDTEKLRSFFADDFIDHDGEGEGPHVDAVTGLYAALAAGAPDSRHELGMVIPSGEDKAVIYWRNVGTNTHDLFGMPTMDPPREFNIAGIEIFTVQDGKITEMWHSEEIHKLVEALTAPE